MKYPASEKLEIIRMVERSHLSVRRTLATLGVCRPTFYRWYARYQRLGEVGLEDRRSGPGRVWNRIPEAIRHQIIEVALERPELSPRELAVTYTDERGYLISEASVYRLLKAQDLIGTPAITGNAVAVRCRNAREKNGRYTVTVTDFAIIGRRIVRRRPGQQGDSLGI